MEGWVWIALAIVLSAAVMITNNRPYQAFLYEWAGVPKYLRSSASPERLIGGLENRSRWLARQAELYGLEQSGSAFDWYLQSFKSQKELAESGQVLRELLERARKLSLEAKIAGSKRRFDQIEAWRADVSTWADVVSRFAPKLQKQLKLQPA
jgi:hypothetical protein